MPSSLYIPALLAGMIITVGVATMFRASPLTALLGIQQLVVGKMAGLCTVTRPLSTWMTLVSGHAVRREL